MTKLPTLTEIYLEEAGFFRNAALAAALAGGGMAAAPHLAPVAQQIAQQVGPAQTAQPQQQRRRAARPQANMQQVQSLAQNFINQNRNRLPPAYQQTGTVMQVMQQFMSQGQTPQQAIQSLQKRLIR